MNSGWPKTGDTIYVRRADTVEAISVIDRSMDIVKLSNGYTGAIRDWNSDRVCTNAKQAWDYLLAEKREERDKAIHDAMWTYDTFVAKAIHGLRDQGK